MQRITLSMRTCADYETGLGLSPGSIRLMHRHADGRIEFVFSDAISAEQKAQLEALAGMKISGESGE
jgi:hypothetical protein